MRRLILSNQLIGLICLKHLNNCDSVTLSPNIYNIKITSMKLIQGPAAQHDVTQFILNTNIIMTYTISIINILVIPFPFMDQRTTIFATKRPL